MAKSIIANYQLSLQDLASQTLPLQKPVDRRVLPVFSRLRARGKSRHMEQGGGETGVAETMQKPTGLHQDCHLVLSQPHSFTVSSPLLMKSAASSPRQGCFTSAFYAALSL